MSYHGLSKKSHGPTCPCGANKSSVFFRLCWKCQSLKNKRNQKAKKKLDKTRRENELALKKMNKLPAKNRKKSKIIDALLEGATASSIKKQSSPKPKTIRYESLERKLLFKKLEEF